MIRALRTLLVLCLVALVLGPALAFTPDRVPSGISTTIVAPSDVATASTVTLSPAGVAFTPDPGKTYLVEVFCSYTTSSTATGIGAVIADSASSFDGSGALSSETRGSSATSTVVISASAIAGNAPSGLVTAGTRSSGSGLTPVYAWTIWTADASPSPVDLYFLSEDGGTVTTKAGKCLLRHLQLD